MFSESRPLEIADSEEEMNIVSSTPQVTPDTHLTQSESESTDDGSRIDTSKEEDPEEETMAENKVEDSKGKQPVTEPIAIPTKSKPRRGVFFKQTARKAVCRHHKGVHPLPHYQTSGHHKLAEARMAGCIGYHVC